MLKPIENAERAYEPIQKNVSMINAQIQLTDMLVSLKIVSEATEGVEQLVKFTISELWFEYSYLSKRVVYHMKNYINAINNSLEWLKTAPYACVDIVLNLLDDLANSIAFEFEGLISAFNKLIEQPMPDQITEKLKSPVINDFPSDLINRKNVDGLYWRINILRNRVVHPDQPKYTVDYDQNACRFISFSSKPRLLAIKEEKLELECNLFDLNENPVIKQIIKTEILDNGNKSPLMDILFPMNSPSGHKKRNPIMVTTGAEIKLFDYINGFSGLSISLLDYMNKINHLFVRKITERFNKKELEQSFCVNEWGAITIKDVFQLPER